jgi:phage gp29-like protein
LQIPEPKDGEAVLSFTANTPGTNTEDAPNQAALAALKANASGQAIQDAEDKELEKLIANLQDKGAAANSAVIDQIKALVMNATSFDQLQEQLLTLPIDPSDMAEVLGQAMAVANAAGRNDVIEGAE